MGGISELPDDLLLKILSFLPTKEAVSTCILSKKWEFLWMWLPKLDYISQLDEAPQLQDFIHKTLPLHRAPVIECFRFRLRLDSWLIKPEDVRKWVEIAVSHHLRELDIDFYTGYLNIFPSNLFTCKSLVTIKLTGGVNHIDVPSVVCLPSLKTLLLGNVIFIDGKKSLQQLLSGCHVLEDLSARFDYTDNMKKFTIIVPSLQSLSPFIADDIDGYEIDTPSLKYLKLVDWNNQEQHYSLIMNMPKLTEAYVDVVPSCPKNLIMGSITSLKRLTICAEGVYGDSCVFNQLEHLTLCVCKEDSSKLLGQLLKDSPKLRVLDISLVEDHEPNCMDCWNQPSSVPECLLSSLQIFNWSEYLGRPQERDIAVYILANACYLKMVKIKSKRYMVPTLYMLKELEFSSRASSTCQIIIF